jgi:hypothetical protein
MDYTDAERELLKWLSNVKYVTVGVSKRINALIGYYNNL